jgi:hypothetical protein
LVEARSDVIRWKPRKLPNPPGRKSMSKWPYSKGLHDLGRGCFAYLQPDGSWGWSNAGLVTDGDQTLLVDTLFDLPPIAEKPVRELKSYFEYIAAQARAHFDNGIPYEVAALKIGLDRFASWLDPERIVINVASLYREFSGSKTPLDRMVMFAGMKRYRDACAHDHAAQA